MRIAFTILDMTAGGGMERTTSLLANMFALQKHHVTIVSVFKSGKSPIFSVVKEVDIRYLIPEKYSHGNSLLKNLSLYGRAILKLRRYYCDNPQDAIIGQAFLCNMFLWLSGNAKDVYACEHFKYEMYNRPIRSFRNWLYKKFRCVVVLTENDAKNYEKRGIHTTIIPNMISFPIASNKPYDYRKKHLISVGRLRPEKGYDLLLQALKPVFCKYPDWRIDIYGEGEDRQKLELLRKKLELEQNVSFPGFSEDIRKEYLSSSFYVMSSRHEGLPMVLLEAMACGLPIVSFDCPEGPASLLKDGVGCLVPPEDVEALSSAICKLIEDKNLRNRYSRKSLEVARSYTSEIIYKKWMDLFEQITRI